MDCFLFVSAKQDRRLLAVMGNIAYTCDATIPALWKSFQKLGLPKHHMPALDKEHDVSV